MMITKFIKGKETVLNLKETMKNVLNMSIFTIYQY